MQVERTPPEYVSWDVTVPTLPARSRLYRLEPYGIGTPWVESLTGYITRLAEAHCVSTGILYAKEIAPVVGKGNIFTFRLTGTAGYPTHAINGLGVTAADFVRALEQLTTRHDLRYLTLLPWKAVLPPGALGRRGRAWCPACLGHWQATRQTVYEPLLWRIHHVTVCPIHQQRLCHVCPHCQRQIGPLDARTRPGYCSRCLQWLGSANPDTLPSDPPFVHEELAWSLWVATTVGDAIAAAPRWHSPPLREHVTQAITVCLNRLSGGERDALAQLLHVGENAVRNWQKGKTLPQFALLLEMSHRLGISLQEFLCGARTASGQVNREWSPAYAQEWHQRTSHPHRGRRIQPVEMEKVLQAALHEQPPWSLRQVTQRCEASPQTMRQHFPHLCQAITARFADYRTIRAAVRKEVARAEVKAVAYELYARGLTITRGRLRPLLTSSDYINMPEGRAALREVRGELGLCAMPNSKKGD
jgi:transcriptional regulator with XRE-family HTH domain